MTEPAIHPNRPSRSVTPHPRKAAERPHGASPQARGAETARSTPKQPARHAPAAPSQATSGAQRPLPGAGLASSPNNKVGNFVTTSGDSCWPLTTNGMWMAEWGARIPYFQPALVNTVTSLEALLKTDRSKLKAQFVARTCALAEELEVDGVTVDAADALYEARSDTVHGGFVRIESDSPDALRLVVFQELLMKSLRRAIEDDGFCERFRSADAVRDFWRVG